MCRFQSMLQSFLIVSVIVSLRAEYLPRSCDPETAHWTSWFNTHHPSIDDRHDHEDFLDIQQISFEVKQCSILLAIDYSMAAGASNTSHQLTISDRGLSCRASPNQVCPDYQIRFCCQNIRSTKSSSTSCGISYVPPNLHTSLRIVNGIESNPHSFPWAVSLRYRGMHDCGGVILDQWHILTAAHCLDYANDLGNYYVHVGAHNRSSSGLLLPTKQLILHPNYDEYRSSNDIGIIKLAAPIPFTPQSQPICLADQIVEPPLGATAYVAGWGNTVHQVPTSTSDVLRQARLKVIADCSMYFAFDAQKQICAASNGPNDKDHGSCQGDSGGALVYSKNGRWYAAGVVSYAIGCGRKAFPTVFTKTSAYIDWIRATISRP